MSGMLRDSHGIPKLEKGIYRHFKGDFYLVEDIAINTTDNRVMVIYKALYDNAQLYARPFVEWFEDVSDRTDNVGQKHRFEKWSVASKKITK